MSAFRRLVATATTSARPITRSTTLSTPLTSRFGLSSFSHLRSYATGQPGEENTKPGVPQGHGGGGGAKPKGLEGLFDGRPDGGDIYPPKPPGTGHPSEPSEPKRPDVGLPGLDGGEGGQKPGSPAEEEGDHDPSVKEKRKKLSEMGGGLAGTKTAFGGGGGGGGGSGGSGGGAGGPGGGFNLTPNQLMLAVISSYALYSLSTPSGGSGTREITWQEFRNSLLARGLVSSLEVINRSQVRVHLHSPIPQRAGSGGVGANGSGGDFGASSPSLPSPEHGPAPYTFTIGSLEAFESLLIQTQDELGIPPAERIPVAYREEVSTAQTIMHFAPSLLIAGLILYMARRGAAGAGGGSGGIFGVGKSKAKMFNKETDISVKFKDVAGMDEAKEVSSTT